MLNRRILFFSRLHPNFQRRTKASDVCVRKQSSKEGESIFLSFVYLSICCSTSHDVGLWRWAEGKLGKWDKSRGINLCLSPPPLATSFSTHFSLLRRSYVCPLILIKKARLPLRRIQLDVHNQSRSDLFCQKHHHGWSHRQGSHGVDDRFSSRKDFW